MIMLAASAHGRPATRRRPALGAAVLAFLLQGLPWGGAIALEESVFLAELREAIIQEMRREQIAGAGIALVVGDEVRWQETFGFADADERRPLTAETPMAVADLAKIPATIALLQQVEAGRIDLDAPVTDYLDLTFEARDTTWRAPRVRELLTHHGGFPPNVFAGSFQEAPPEGLWLPDPVPLAQPPGTIYAYSNIGFQLAGRLVEVASGERYAAYLADHVFAPLGLERTTFAPPPTVARPHDEHRRPEPLLFSRDLAALGLFASLEDLTRLLRWVIAGDGAPLLSKASFEAMSTVQNEAVALDLDNRAGLGWQLTNTGGHRVERILRMNAITLGHRGLMLVAPEQRVGVVMIANSLAAGELVPETSAQALDGLLDVHAGITPPDEDRSLPDDLPLPAAATAAPMARRYNTPIGELTIEGSDGSYELELAGRGFSLRERPDGWSTIAYKFLGIFRLRFSILKEILLRPAALGGHEVLLAHFRGSAVLFGTALDGMKRHPELAAWAGTYRLANPDPLSERFEIEEATVLVEDGRAYVEYRLPGIVSLRPRVPVVPFAEGRLYVPGLGLNAGDTLRLERGNGRRIIEYSGWRLVETP